MPADATWSAMLARRDPRAPAVMDEEGMWSTAELIERAAGAAAWLDAAGVSSGGPVAALLTTRPGSLALIVAGAGSARPVAPLGPRLTVRELAACVAGLGSKVLVTEAAFAELAGQVGACTGGTVLVVPEGGFERLDPGGVLDLAPPPHAVAFVLHTSGTSGLPKAVPVRQDRLAVRVRTNAALVELGPGRIYASASTFHHIAGLGMLAVALGAGASVYCLAAFSVDAWRRLGQVGVTNALLVPTMIETLLDEGALEIETLRLMQYGASPIHPDTLRRTLAVLPGVRLLQIFGQTEGSPIAVLTPDDHRAAAAGREELLATVGRAAPGIELRIEGSRGDGVGEVCARGAHLFRVDDDGWLRTGDLGTLDDDGVLRLVGRIGDRIIRGGENVYPQEIEDVLVQHPAVAEAAAVGVPDQRWGEIVKVFVVPADIDAPPTDGELRAFARSQLAGYKVPTAWEIVARLPRSSQGKVLRRVLRPAEKGHT